MSCGLGDGGGGQWWAVSYGDEKVREAVGRIPFIPLIIVTTGDYYFNYTVLIYLIHTISISISAN